MMKTKFAGASFPSFLPSRRVARKSSTRNGRTNGTKAREEALERAETRVSNARRRCQRSRARATFFSRKDKKNTRARRFALEKKNNFNADCTRAPSPSFSPCLVGDDDAFLFVVFLTSRPDFREDFFLERRVCLRVIVVS